MLRFMLQRLLLLLPTVWIILSFVFLLSRIIPGTFEDRREEAAQALIGKSGYYRQGSEAAAGQPLFYFSLRPLAYPDTLYRVMPRHRHLLQALATTYGNWPLVAAYYHQLLQLQKTAAASPTALSPAQVTGPLAGLFRQHAPEQVFQLLDQLRAGSRSAGMHLLLDQTAQRFQHLVHEAQPWQAFVPAFSWHGTANQYHNWLRELLQADLGYSYRDRQPVLSILSQAMGHTLLLLGLSLGCTFLISIELSLALMAAGGRRWRRPVLTLLLILDSVPLFMLALLLLVVLAGAGLLKLFPLFGLGYADPDALAWEAFIQRLYHLFLPGVCLVLAGTPYVTTQLYRVMQQVAGATFIMTARAKGLSERVVLRQHIFGNALLPLITLFTGFLPAIISGAVVVEVIFAIPGTGRLLADSVLARDYPVVLGLVFFLASLKALTHLLADFLYFVADPRTRIKIA